jgi:RHS repeat-associated protein
MQQPRGGEQQRPYGHRLTARYNVNNHPIIDDDPVDVYAYDRLWRVRTVTRATPSGSGAEATWTWYVREKWYYHDTESGQEMMTGPNSTDAPIMRLIDRNGDGDFNDPGEEQHFVNDHQGSTVLVTGKATLDSEGNLVARAPIIAHVKYDQHGLPKFVHPADVNSDGVVDAADDTFWKQAWNEYVNGASGQTPPKEIWKGVADADESGVVDETEDGSDPTLPSAANADWVAFQARYTAATVGSPPTLAEQLGNLPLYAGYWWDDAVGLYHVRHRVYRPEWGRWLQRDPLGYAPGWNLYQYVNGMPWASVDPMGLDARRAPDGDGEWSSEFIVGEGSQQRVRVRQWVRKNGQLSLPGYTDYFGADSLPGKSQSAEEFIRQAQTGVVPDAAAPIADDVAEAHQRQFDTLAEQTKSGIRDFYITGPLLAAGFSGVGAVRQVGSIIEETAAAARASRGATRLMDASEIRFSQNSIRGKFSDGADVEDLVNGLKSGRIQPDDVETIRVFQQNGKTYTLDNRRLYAAQKAGTKIRVREATAEEIRNQLGNPQNTKLTTNTDGNSVRMRGTDKVWTRPATPCDSGNPQ